MRLLRLASIFLVFSTFGYGQHAGMPSGGRGFPTGRFASGRSRGSFVPSPSGHDGHLHNFPFRRFPSVWGYSYWPGIFDDWGSWDNFDSQPTGNYAAPQSSYNGNGDYQDQPQPDDQGDPSAERQAQPSSSSRRAPDQGDQTPFQPSGGVVFKNGLILEYKWAKPKTARGSR
jgi:hypothetical protein